MKPPFAYYGGKVGLAPRIVEMMPAHRVYIEPFFGSGAVLFAKPPARIEIGNDLDLNVWTFFQVLRTRPEDLEMACRLTPYHREEFQNAELDGEMDDLERARRFWVRVNQSFAKTAGRQTGFSLTTARTQSTAASVWSRMGRFAQVAERLQRVCWERCDAAELITRMATAPDVVVYLDPPYLADTRRGRDRQRPADYLSDMGEPVDHIRLAAAAKATPATVILSGYPSDLYEDLYEDWWYTDVAVTVHSSNSATRERGKRTERIWMNRPPGAGLFAMASSVERGAD